MSDGKPVACVEPLLVDKVEHCIAIRSADRSPPDKSGNAKSIFPALLFYRGSYITTAWYEVR
jgi:hypothetical protein